MAQRERRYYVYILTNPSQHPFYTGVTSDVGGRVLDHRSHQPGSYTARYNLARLVYYETFRYVKNAIAREKEIKGWGRAKKLALIRSVNPKLDDLALGWGKSFLKHKEKT
ncbi:MAG TPA: GIY-YIG nuclease family protein [Terriglobales bacterium]|nr:GIY-YIG nuclease family protein [Terriglobales bacterium]